MDRLSIQGASLAVAVTLLVGCGTAQPSLGTASSSIVPSSRRDSNAAAGDLLYVVRRLVNKVDVYKYPRGEPTGSIATPYEPFGACTDTASHVWVTMYTEIAEYAHGGDAPIAQLNDGEEFAVACSVDPKTGNLAVSNSASPSSANGNLLVFEHASGSPKVYTDPQFYYYLGCVYDRKGNLYVDGVTQSGVGVFAELPARGNRLKTLSLDHAFQGPGDIEWDGQYVAVGSPREGLILRFTITGTYGEEQGSTSLNRFQNVEHFFFPLRHPRGAQTASRVIAGDSEYGETMFWEYPIGGHPTKKLKPRDEGADAAVVSFANASSPAKRPELRKP